jgi:hypothetical protein
MSRYSAQKQFWNSARESPTTFANEVLLAKLHVGIMCTNGKVCVIRFETILMNLQLAARCDASELS